jgi:hypothetical protein
MFAGKVVLPKYAQSIGSIALQRVISLIMVLYETN